MTARDRQKDILILGGTGRVGRALAAVRPAGQGALWQHRPGTPAPAAAAPADPAPAAALAWDPLTAPPGRLPAGIGCVLSLLRGRDAAEEVALGQAACDLGARLGVPVLLASSQAVYGAQSGPLTEASRCDPHSDYGRSKLALERAVAGRATCLRIGNVAGCDMLLMNAATGPVTLDRLPGGGSPRRCYIGPQVLWQAIAALGAGQGALPPVLNLAQPGPVAMADLLDAAGLGWDWRTAPPGVLPALDLDLTRLAGLVDLPPATPAGLIAQARAAGWARA